jgi:hypothetical protein
VTSDQEGATGDATPAGVVTLLIEELEPTVRDLAALQEDTGKFQAGINREFGTLLANLGNLHERVDELARGLRVIRAELAGRAGAEDQEEP